MQMAAKPWLLGYTVPPWRNGRGLLAVLAGSLYLQQFPASSPIKAGPEPHDGVVWVAVFVK